MILYGKKLDLVKFFLSTDDVNMWSTASSIHDVLKGRKDYIDNDVILMTASDFVNCRCRGINMPKGAVVILSRKKLPPELMEALDGITPAKETLRDEPRKRTLLCRILRNDPDKLQAFTADERS